MCCSPTTTAIAVVSPLSHSDLVALVLPAGLLPYVQPQTPASLDAGEYIAKGADEEFGVETLIRAAAAAGVSLAACDVVTYRNNLNKWVLQGAVCRAAQCGGQSVRFFTWTCLLAVEASVLDRSITC